jgi:hypothetical protein
MGMDINGAAAWDVSAYSVSLSADENTVAIGAYGNDDAGLNAGHCRIFHYDGSSWNQLGSDIDGEAADDLSGVSVNLSADGNTVAIGARTNDGGGTDAGHVRVYNWDGDSWNQVGDDIDGESAEDQSGISVSLSADGNIVAIGAYLNDGAGIEAGHTRIYSWDGSSWNQLGTDIDGEDAGDRSGFSVSLSDDGNTVAIGAYLNDDSGLNSGQCRIFNWDGSSWNQIGTDIDGEAANDLSGLSVSLSADGNTVAIGASGNDGAAPDAGHCRIYNWDGSSWNQLGIDIDGESSSDKSGYSVSLSADGNSVAIGAYNNDDAGLDAGHCRIYNWDGGSWNQVDVDIDGEAADDYSGFSVSISANGTKVAIGAYFNDGGAMNAGHCRVYEYCIPPEIPTLSAVETTICPGGSTDLSVTSGDLNSANDWEWYAGSCGGISEGTGSTISVSPATTTTYYVRGEGGCVDPGDCESITITVEDVTDPIADLVSLDDINEECSASPDAPSATDECAGSIEGVPDVIFPIVIQGTTVVTWTYDDGNGNIITQTQNVILDDLTNPVPDLVELSDINSECDTTPVTPTALDNCAGTIVGVPDVAFPITAPGTTVVTWIFDDGNGNSITQSQNVIIVPIDNSVTQSMDSLIAEAIGYNYQWVDCNDSNSPITGETDQYFIPSENGSYACEISNGECSVTSECVEISDVGIHNQFGSDFRVYPNPTTGFVTIDFNQMVGQNFAVSITDVEGRVIFSDRFSDNVIEQKINLDLSIYNDGLYFIVLQSETDSVTKKVTKK